MFRELDQRHSDGLTVTLEWDPAGWEVQVRCEDHRSPEQSFKYSVDPEDARLAFLHPFTLRPSSQDSDASAGSPNQGPTGGGKRRRWYRQRPKATSNEQSSDYSWLRWARDASDPISDYNWLWRPPDAGEDCGA